MLIVTVLLICVTIRFTLGRSYIKPTKRNQKTPRSSKEANRKPPPLHQLNAQKTNSRLPSSQKKISELKSDLLTRLSNIKNTINSSDNADKVISDFLSDISLLDASSKEMFLRDFTNQISQIESEGEGDNKFEWLADLYPSIKKTLASHVVYPRSLESNVFAYLNSKCFSAGLDPYQEALKIKNLNTREDFIVGLLPHMITLNSYDYPDITKKLSPQLQKTVEQSVIQESVNNRIYRIPALELYLDNGGTKGKQEEQIKTLFNDSAWFWKNSDKIGETIENSERGDRRDIAIENMIKIIQRRDPESARKWLDEIDDQARAQNINSKLFNQ